MVQIIPEAPSFGTQFARGLGAGASQSLINASELRGKADLEKQKMKQLQDLIGGGETSGSQQKQAPIDHEKMEQEFLDALPEIEENIGRELTPQDLNKLWPKFQEHYQSSQQQQSQQQIGQQQQQQQQEQGQKRQYSASERLALGGYPQEAKVFAEGEKSKNKQEFAREQKGEEKLQELNDRLQSREGTELRYGRLGELFSPENESKFPPRLMAAAFTKDGELNAFGLANLSDEATETIKLISDELSGAKDTFGARVTNFDLQSYMKRLPSLLSSAEGRRRVLRDLQLMNKLNMMHDQGVIDIVDRYGGPGKISISKAEQLFRNQNKAKIAQIKQEFINPNKAKFSSLEDADPSMYQGREIEDEATGQTFVSNGKEWVPKK